MAKKISVVNMDPITSKKELGIIGRFLITRWHGGNKIKRMDRFGHYMFCGEQGSGKTASALWYAEKLGKKYKKKGKTVKLYSNIGIGEHIKKDILCDVIENFTIDHSIIRIVIIDEIHTYFPKDSITGQADRLIRNKMISLFSQLRKRSTYILSTAQIYGRLDKSLREQCLYMINCKTKRSGKLVNEFIPQIDIIADELGRWAGRPAKIHIHGLSKLEYDTTKIIYE